MDHLLDLERRLQAAENRLAYFETLSKGYAWGTWTPTLNNTTNVASSSANVGRYLRVGNVVHCSVRVEIDVTAATTTVLGVSLPIASDFASVVNCAGAGVEVGGMSGEIRADATNNWATFAYTSTVTANNAFYLIFSYQII